MKYSEHHYYYTNVVTSQYTYVITEDAGSLSRKQRNNGIMRKLNETIDVITSTIMSCRVHNTSKILVWVCEGEGLV